MARNIADDEMVDGTVMSIHVQNFLCHDNFRVEFKKRVTFIVGLNGSGKSAILAALVVGLGGRAATTNKGKSVKDFIKRGMNSANIEIKLRNSSIQAYRPDDYGSHITVVKHISISGTSTYQIKAASGKLVSTSAKELKAILIALDIKVENPISVLNQDDAREFAKNTKSTTLYDLFKRATNMDVIETNYERARQYCNDAVALWETKNRYCDELKLEYQKLQKQCDQMQSRKEMENKIRALKSELVWSEIAEAEREVADIRQRRDRQRARCDQIQDRVRAMEQGAPSDEIQRLKVQLEESVVQKSALEQKMREEERRLRQLRDARTERQAELERKKKRLERELKKVRDFEQEMRNIESGGPVSQREALEQRVEQKRAAAAEARVRLATLQNDAQQARENAARARDLVERAAGERRHRTERLRGLERQLGELEQSGSDVLAVYGSRISRLCQEVQRAAERGHFSAPPRGPVGQYIKVKSDMKEWSGTLEHIMGNMLRSFCVNTIEDSKKLFRIMDQVLGNESKPSVTCSKFLQARHDVRRGSVLAPPHCSALQALDVDDPVIANFLIDNLSLEKVLLVPDHDKAMQLSSSQAAVPANCRKIVTLDCTEYFPAPHYRSYGGRPRAPKFLHSSNAERTQQLMTEIEQMRQNSQAHEKQVQKLQDELQRAQRGERAASTALQALGAQLCRHEADEREAAAELELLQTPQRSVLEEELNIAKQSVEMIRDSVRGLKDTDADVVRELAECDARAKEAQAAVTQATGLCRKLSEHIDQEQLKLERKALEQTDWQKRLEEDRNKLEQVESILSEKENAVAASISARREQRIDNARDKAVITRLIMESKTKIKSYVVPAGSRDELEQKRAEAEAVYRRMVGFLDDLKEHIGKAEELADGHLKFCFKMRCDRGHEIGLHFMATLRTRGYNGRIEIDHEKEEMRLVVTGGQVARNASSAAALSGGECSYTNVAFITALWECIEMPFYFMDEYDVFMDGLNQQIIVNLLLGLAAQRAGRQFVFLTPNGVNVAPGSTPVPVDVISLNDPKR